MINKSSVKFTAFAARVMYGNTVLYTFTSKKTGKEQTGHKFECCLVGKSETGYVKAVLNGTESEVAAAKELYKDGTIWEVSNIKFQEKTAPAFISSALKVSVDIAKSNFKITTDSDLEGQLAKIAVPPRTVAETGTITSTRQTDLLAIVTSHAPIRTTKRGNVLDVTIMDASEDTPGCYAKVLVSVWGSAKQKLVAIGKLLVFSTWHVKSRKTANNTTTWKIPCWSKLPPVPSAPN